MHPARIKHVQRSQFWTSRHAWNSKALLPIIHNPLTTSNGFYSAILREIVLWTSPLSALIRYRVSTLTYIGKIGPLSARYSTYVVIFALPRCPQLSTIPKSFARICASYHSTQWSTERAENSLKQSLWIVSWNRVFHLAVWSRDSRRPPLRDIVRVTPHATLRCGFTYMATAWRRDWDVLAGWCVRHEFWADCIDVANP